MLWTYVLYIRSVFIALKAENTETACTEEGESWVWGLGGFGEGTLGVSGSSDRSLSLSALQFLPR